MITILNFISIVIVFSKIVRDKICIKLFLQFNEHRRLRQKSYT